MAWGNCVISLWLLGGFVNLVQGGDFHLDGFSQNILDCVKCFPPVPEEINGDETPEPIDKGTDKGTELQRKIDGCIEAETAKWSLYIRKGMDHQLQEYKETVLDLCLEGTDLHEMYLKHSECINKQFVYFCEPHLNPKEKINECELEIKRNICFKDRVLKNCGKDSLLLLRTWYEKVFEEFVVCWKRKTASEEQSLSASDALLEKLERLESEFYDEVVVEETFPGETTTCAPIETISTPPMLMTCTQNM